MRKGKFITLEGPDGSGKTTNVDIIVEHLRQTGYEVVRTREPGGSPVGEKIRTLLLDKNNEMCAMTELLLFAAARAQHIEQVIRPALERGAIVVSDRFHDSSYAYQGAGRGYSVETKALEEFVHRGFVPDITLFFNITLEESLLRLAIREQTQAADRFESEKMEFRRRVWEGYQERFNDNPHRMFEINAMGTTEEVKQRVMTWLDKVFIPAFPPPLILA